MAGPTSKPSVLGISFVPLVWLPVLTFLTYLLSYLYLAAYHGRANLLNVIIHAGGTYTLLETTFYASHFLGHVPVHTVAALVFLGACYSLLSPGETVLWERRSAAMGTGILALLGLSFVGALVHFGYDDTVSFILQRKQTVTLHVRGGSWNLHMPSTMLLFAWVPVYVVAVSLICGRGTAWSTRGLAHYLAAVLLFIGVTILANGRETISALAVAVSDPRYQAHSVRELVTFSMVYFPIPLFFLLRPGGEPRGRSTRLLDPANTSVLCLAGIVVVVGVAYQCVVSLSAGIGALAHKPDFAHEGRLSVLYLLGSHFFEHVLDSIYFGLLVLWLYGLGVNRGGAAHEDA
ncbi:MAG: hypothetical protein ISS31_01040 [Kiritimatiellae bacterium]|nr:hypothetical protein [Kiritimatiellia bacterium]